MTVKQTIPNEDFYFELIAKELNGELSAEEKSSLLEWANKEAQNRTVYEETVKSWQLALPKMTVPGFSSENAWAKLHASTSKLHRSTLWNRYSIGTKIAASVILAVGLTTLTMFLATEQTETITFSALGETMELTLPDSSHVVLNKNSTLTYAADFASTNRVVTLEGEAFFEVKKVAGKSFEVIGNRTITTVLGTSFSVQSIKGLPEVIQVITGKVNVVDKENPTKNNVLLTPGLKAELSSLAVFSKDSIANINFVAWKDKRIRFENTSLSEVVHTLEIYFDTKIEVANPSLLTCRFTGTFENPKFQEVLEVVTLSTNTTFQLKKEKTILSGTGCLKTN